MVQNRPEQQREGSRSAIIAAALIMLSFCLLAFFMPTIMLAAGAYSGVLAALIMAVFILSFFIVFWLRSRSQKTRDN